MATKAPREKVSSRQINITTSVGTSHFLSIRGRRAKSCGTAKVTTRISNPPRTLGFTDVEMARMGNSGLSSMNHSTPQPDG